MIERVLHWTTWTDAVFDHLTPVLGATPDRGPQRAYRDGAVVVSYQFEDQRGDVYVHVWVRDLHSGAFLALAWEAHDPAEVAASLLRVLTRLYEHPDTLDVRGDVYEFTFGPLGASEAR